jgi:hypothetical protein
MVLKQKDFSNISQKELANSKKIFKSETPKHDLSWYIKWASSILIIVAILVRSAGISPLTDLSLSFLGCLGWLVVGLLWKDRALLILNSVCCSILATGILNYIVENYI